MFGISFGKYDMLVSKTQYRFNNTPPVFTMCHSLFIQWISITVPIPKASRHTNINTQIHTHIRFSAKYLKQQIIPIISKKKNPTGLLKSILTLSFHLDSICSKSRISGSIRIPWTWPWYSMIA